MDYLIFFAGTGVGAFLVTMAYLLMATTTTKKRNEEHSKILEIQERNGVALETIAKVMQVWEKRR